MKNVLIEKGDELICATNIGIETITSKFKTYEPVIENVQIGTVYNNELENEDLEKENKFEEETGEQMSIFDDFF